MIDSMKAYLFGVMVHPIMPQCIVTGIQWNQIIRKASIVLSCTEQAGMTQTAEGSLAISAKNPKVIFWNYILFIVRHLGLECRGTLWMLQVKIHL